MTTSRERRPLIRATGAGSFPFTSPTPASSSVQGSPRERTWGLAHFGLGYDLFFAEELAVQIEYDLGAKTRISAGWRWLRLDTDDESMEMIFGISGVTAGVVIVL